MSQKSERGLFIAVYASNNLGKTTACNGVVKTISERTGRPVKLIKYPVYDHPPTGPRINAYLRQGNPEGFTMLEAQKVYAQNRIDYDPILEQTLDSGIHVVAEDYTLTGTAWGVTGGVPVEIMESINCSVRKPDISILIDGERFSSGHENKHTHESNDNLCKKNREVHQMLARRYNFPVVCANQEPDKVVADLMAIISPRLK